MTTVEMVFVGFGLFICLCVSLGVSAFMLANFLEAWKEFKKR